jgi:hypothetical protein
MANCVCAACKRIMDCTGEVVCELCEILLEREQERTDQLVNRLIKPKDDPFYRNLIKP